MNDFLLNILKGLHPLYFFLLLWGVIHRIRCRKWHAFDTLLLFSFLLFEFLAALQTAFFYGILSTSKRYLWMGMPLGLPFAADGLLGMLNHPKLKKISVFLCILLFGVNIYNAFSPVIHEKHSAGKLAERAISREAAAWIVQDWNHRQYRPIAVFKCDQYQSGKRPLVQSELLRIGWLCGGQNHPAFFTAQQIMPDYIVSRFPVRLPDFVLIQKLQQVRIYKSRNSRP